MGLIVWAFTVTLCFTPPPHTHTHTLLIRRELLAELVEDERVAVEIARLEEEFHVLSEENRTLLTVHTERAQQLETLSLTNQSSQDSS